MSSFHRIGLPYVKLQMTRNMSTQSKKPVFFDMVHSNNAARIRLWLRLKGMEGEIETRMVTYPDLQTEEFKAAVTDIHFNSLDVSPSRLLIFPYRQ